MISRRQAGSAAAVAVTVVDYQKTSKAAMECVHVRNVCMCGICVCFCSPMGEIKFAIRQRLLNKNSLSNQSARAAERERESGKGSHVIGK